MNITFFIFLNFLGKHQVTRNPFDFRNKEKFHLHFWKVIYNQNFKCTIQGDSGKNQKQLPRGVLNIGKLLGNLRP